MADIYALSRGVCFFFFQAEDGIRDIGVTGVQTCALPIFTFDEESLEQYLTVESRQGRRTWTWKLDGSARARLLDGGLVGFVDEQTGRVSDVLLGKAKIFDTRGKDVTPSGTRWQLFDRGKAQLLALDLDDAELPVPYVIDPIAYRANNAGVSNGAGSTSLTPTIPAAVREGDFLLAHVGIRDD